MKYSAIIEEHFHRPRHVGPLDGATHVGKATNEACLDSLWLYLLIENDRIVDAAFRAQGCVPTIAIGSALSEFLIGKGLEEVRKIDECFVEELVGGLPRQKRHAAMLAVDALRNALGENGR